MNLNDLSKEQLIELVRELSEEKGIPEEKLLQLEEDNLRSEAWMESHGRIDYGYGIGAYGPL